MNILDELNESQRKAVLYTDGPHLVIAGAGSGKTRVLTYKVAYLLSQGVPSGSILALAFTNKAAREMKERIAKMVGEQEARYLSMGTFHSIFARILRHEADKLGYSKDYSIYDTSDSKSLLKRIIKEMDLDEKIYKPSSVLGYISDAKNNLLTPRDYVDNRDIQTRDKINRMYRMSDVYRIYQSRLREANAMDFDDLLFNMNILLEKFPAERRTYQERFRYILVDEYQDTNYSQYCIIHHLADLHRNICVVGDDAQSIYSFRGADIRNILQFQHEYEGAPIFKLERNYRSTQNIVNAASSLIGKNRHQIPKNVYSENGVGLPIQISSHANDHEEGRFLAKKVASMHSLQGRSYDDIAILYRTNAQSRVIEEEFRKLGLPYRIYGGVSFYQRKEVKDVLSYFRLVTNLQDDEALMRIINYPARTIGETTMKKVAEVAHTQGLSLYDVVAHPESFELKVNGPTKKKLQQFAVLIQQFQSELETLDAYSFAQLVIKQTGIKTSLALDRTQEGVGRAQNVDSLLTAIREFVELQGQYGVEEVDVRSYLSEVALQTDQDEQQSDNTPRVTLMTVHSAKGLEYGAVLIAGLEEELFPSAYSSTDKELEEERRLLYVAITRAKEECYITSAAQRFRNGQLLSPEPSRFLKEIDSQYVQRAREEVRRPRWESFDDDWDEDARWQVHEIPTRPQAAPSAPPFVPRMGSLKSTTGMQPKGDKIPIAPPFPIGSRVCHKSFGNGTIKDAYRENGNDKVVIAFDQVGQKTMMLQYAKLEQI